MSAFNKLHRKILATLEEAGEDYIAGLANTVLERRGSREEIDSYCEALKDLFDRNLLEVARDRDPNSRRLIRLQKPEAVAILAGLDNLFTWSATERLWKWTGGSTTPIETEVVLTDKGLSSAQKMLSEGWTPERDLEWLKKHG